MTEENPQETSKQSTLLNYNTNTQSTLCNTPTKQDKAMLSEDKNNNLFNISMNITQRKQHKKCCICQLFKAEYACGLCLGCFNCRFGVFL